MSRHFFVRRGSIVKGPLAVSQIRTSLINKKLQVSDEIASTADGPWNRMATVYKDLIDGRTPRLLTDRPVAKPRAVAAADDSTEELDATPEDQPADESDELAAIDEAVRLIDQMPPELPPVDEDSSHQPTRRRKISRSGRANSPDSRHSTSHRQIASQRAGLISIAILLICAGGLVAAALTGVLDRPKPQANPTAQASSPGAVSGPQSLQRGLVQVQRALGLNQAERTRLRAALRKIESELRISEASHKTVFQEQVSRLDTAIQVTALLCEALGATPQATMVITSQLETADVTAETVFQQLAGHLTVYIEILGLAAQQAGAATSEIARCKTELELREITAKTVQQQIASRILAAQEIAALLAKELGAPAERISTLNRASELDDSLSKTVFQQMSARQLALVKLIGAAALAQGADPLAVTKLETSLTTDDLHVETVQQQLSSRLKRGLEMSVMLVEAVVMK